MEAFGSRTRDEYVKPRPVGWGKVVSLYRSVCTGLQSDDFVNVEGTYITPRNQEAILAMHPAGLHLRRWLANLIETRDATVPLPLPPYATVPTQRPQNYV